MYPLQVVVHLCTLQCCIEYRSTVLYFKPRMSRSIGDIAGTAKKCQELENPRKDEEGQEEEEVTEEPKRSMTREMARGVSLFEEAL